jgi:spore coat polysaccharide biosynthesis protein SpsF
MQDNLKIIALVQARLGSCRLPGKMLMDLCGQPILHWVLYRVSQARRLTEVVLATTELRQDDSLTELAQRLGIEFFRGSEADVLGRFWGAAREFKAEVVVRICADNPFIAPEEIDRLVDCYFSRRQSGGDPRRLYAFNHLPTMNNDYPDGLGAEIFSRELLETLEGVAREPSEREHVTTYLWEHPGDFEIYPVFAPPGIAYPGVKLDVDTQEDLDRMRQLGARLSQDSSAIEVVRAYLDLFGAY